MKSKKMKEFKITINVFLCSRSRLFWYWGSRSLPHVDQQSHHVFTSGTLDSLITTVSELKVN